MEPDSQINILEAQIRECYGKVVWSHKTQEKCADIILSRHKTMQIAQIVLSAITTTGVLVAVFGENIFVGIITAIVSATLFGLNTYVKGYNLGEIAQKHSDSANKLWEIRESYLSLLTDIKARIISIEDVLKNRNDLQEKLGAIYAGSPRTVNKAYKLATEALHLNQELTFTDEEIDLLLPSELRKSKQINTNPNQNI